MVWSGVIHSEMLYDGFEFITFVARCSALVVLLLTSCLLGFLYVVHLKRLKTIHYMEKFPGRPEKIPLLRVWIIHRTLLRQAHLVDYSQLLFQLSNGGAAIYRKEGMLRFYGATQPTLALFKACFVEDVLTSNAVIEKSSEYNIIKPWLGTGLLTSGGSKWRTRRRLLTPSFHFRTLDDFLPPINEQSVIFVEKLRNVKGVENIVPLVTRCTLDIISETIMGHKLNAQSDNQSDYVRAIQVVGEIFNMRLESPLYWIEFLFRMSTAGREFHRNLRILHDFTRKVIHERKIEIAKETIEEDLSEDADTNVYGQRPRTRRRFLDILLREHLKDPLHFTEEDVREEVDTFMFEGHDTTAMGISWALYLIGRYPEHQELIHEELEKIFEGDKKRPVTLDDVKEMKYLECCLKESQRLYPSVPFIGRTCTADIDIGGHTLPKGAAIQISIFSLHRDDEVFPKPEEFQPSRFLPENSSGRHPFAYVPFSAGPRNCVGQRFALLEEKIVVANVLRNFRLASQQQRDEVFLVAELVLRPKNGLLLKLIPK